MHPNQSLTPPPMRLDPDQVPPGVLQCDAETGSQWARFALAQLKNSESGFPRDFIPNPTLVRCALLGSHTVHVRNFSYDEHRSLKEIIENKISRAASEIYILAINDANSYYCFSIAKFSYPILDALKDRTGAVDFILLIPSRSGGFVFFEDSPACFMFFADEHEFERDFMSPNRAMSIFSDHMDEWRITQYDKERRWLENIKKELVPA